MSNPVLKGYKYIICYVSDSSFSNRFCLFCSAAFQIIVTKIIRTKREKLFRCKNVFKNLGYVIQTGTCTNRNLERIFDVVVGLSKILRLTGLLKFLCIVKLSIKKGISFTWKKSATMLKIQIFFLEEGFEDL